MDTFRTGTASVLGRCVSAEIRARLGAQRLTQRQLASGAGFSSHNYVSIRLRDEKPFSLDDIEQIADFFGVGDEPEAFVKTAWDRHMDEVTDALYDQLRDAAEADVLAAGAIDQALKAAKAAELDRQAREEFNSPSAARRRAREAREAELGQSDEESGESGRTA